MTSGLSIIVRQPRGGYLGAGPRKADPLTRRGCMTLPATVCGHVQIAALGFDRFWRRGACRRLMQIMADRRPGRYGARNTRARKA